MGIETSVAEQQRLAQLEAQRQAAIKAAREAAERLAQQEAAKAEQGAKDDVATVERDTFVNDEQLQQQLGKSKEELAALFDEASKLDGQDGLSNDELEQAFLTVKTGAKLQEIEAPEKPEEKKEKEEGPIDAEKAEETLKEVVGEDSPALKKYELVKAAIADDPTNPENAAKLFAATTELLKEAQKAPGGKGAAMKNVYATIAHETKEATEKLEKSGLSKVGRLAEGLETVVGLATALGTMADLEGKDPQNPADVLSAGSDALEAMTKLVGDGTKPGLAQELGVDAKDLGLKMAQGLDNLAARAGGTKTFEVLKATWGKLVKACGKYGAEADKLLGAIKAKLTDALSKAATATEGQAEEFVAGRLATVLGKLAQFAETLGPVGTAVDIALQVTDYMLRDLYAPCADAAKGLLAAPHHMGNNPAILTADFAEGGDALAQRAKALADPDLQKANGYDKLYADSAKQAGDFIDGANGKLGIKKDIMAPDSSANVSEVQRDRVQAELGQQTVDVIQPDGSKSQANAGELYAKVRAGKPLTPAEKIALAGPLGTAAAKSVAMEMAKCDEIAPSSLPPELASKDLIQAMAAHGKMNLVEYADSLSKDQLDKLPTDVKKELFQQLAAQSTGLGQVATGEDFAKPEGRVLAAYMKDLQKAGMAPSAQAKEVNDLLAGSATLDRDNVVRQAVDALERDELDQLPTKTKEALIGITNQGLVQSSDAACATKLAESMRRDGEAGKADEIEGQYRYNADVVARTRVAVMTDKELDKLPLQEKKDLAAKMTKGMFNVVTDEDGEQVGRLAASIARNSRGELAPDQAQYEARAMTDGLFRTHADDAAAAQVEAMKPEELDKLPHEDKLALIDKMTKAGTRVEENEVKAIAKLAVSLMKDAGQDPAASYQEVQDRLVAADRSPLNLFAGGDTTRDDVAREVVSQLKEQGEKANPPADLVAALPDGVKQKLIDDLVAVYPSSEDMTTAMALANAMQDPANKDAALKSMDTWLTGQSDLTAASLANTSDADLAKAVAGDDAKALELIKQLEGDTFYTSADKDQAAARVALARLAAIDASNATPEAKQAAKLEFLKQVDAATGSSSKDDVANAITYGLAPSQLSALGPAARQQLATMIKGDGWTVGEEDKDALRRLDATNEYDAGTQLSGDAQLRFLGPMDSNQLLKMVVTRPEEVERGLEAIAALPDSPQKAAAMAHIAKAFREHDHRTDGCKAATEARLKQLGL